MNHTTPHIVAYALTKDLEQYAGRSLPPLPGKIQQDPSWDAFIEQAGSWIRAGEQAVYDPSRPAGLMPLTEYMKLSEDEAYSPRALSFPFKALNIQANWPDENPKSKEDFDKLWKDYEQEYRKVVELTGTHPHNFSETLYFLLKKYTTFLPVSQSGPLQAVSLFEYLKLRASMAECLQRVAQSDEQPDYPLLFFCADISGIQDFIYNIVRNKALKALKGRSFYLQLLLDSLTQQLIDHEHTAISMAHVVYSAGGKMYVLLPNISEVQNALNNINHKLDALMWDQFKGRLQVCMGQIPFRFAANQQYEVPGQGTLSMSELWAALRQQTARQKLQPFRSLLNEKYRDFFQPLEEGLDEQADPLQIGRTLCALTGEPVSFNSYNKEEINRLFQLNDDKKDQDPIYVEKLVKSHARLGYQMKNVMYYNTPQQGKEARFGAFSSAEIPHALKRNQEVVDEYFSSPKQLGVYLTDFKHNRIRYVNTTDFLRTEEVLKEHQANSSYGFYFYGGNQPAFEKDANGRWKELHTGKGRFKEKETQQLAGELSEEDKHKGFHRLGVLRMDVDRLGYLFSHALSGFNSMAAHATFSAQLDWFFGGYLNYLRNCEKPSSKDEPYADCNSEELPSKDEPYADWVNILYAGGDDLFLYGRWDMALSMAERIRSDFSAFTAHRKGLSLSGGLALIGPKFPFSKGAEWAGEAEDEAKRFPAWKPEPTKNAFHFLGQTLSWEKEFDFVQRQMNTIYNFLLKDQLRNHFIYKLYNLKRLKTKGINDWIWLLVYNFSQYADQAKSRGQKELYAFFHEMKNNTFTGKEGGKEVLAPGTDKSRMLDLYVLACQWAELKARSIKKN